jgi:glycine/D-amino acid oxidase-like deaminating enzyme
MPVQLHADVLIFGGGIAGLWTLARLKRIGFECVLVESHALGSGQTIASQGIIHGGLKYALDGQVGSAASSIAAMPDMWRSCLTGAKDAPVDLRGVPVLSEHYHYWTSPGVMSRLAGAGASKVMRTAVERLSPADRPGPLRGAPTGMGGVDVYRVGEMVLDSRQLVLKLGESGRGRIVHGDITASDALARGSGPVRVRCVDGREVEIKSNAIVIAAGAGNEELLGRFGVRESVPIRMQRRPLHMVMVRSAPGEFFGHCIGTSSSPRLTITSGAMHATGEPVWYIGGQIAEEGVARSVPEQIAAAKCELAACLPWMSLPESVRWATLRVDRAEGVPQGSAASGLLPGMRPDVPIVVAHGRVIAAWPTKLAFAPLLADEVERALGAMGVRPMRDGSLDAPVPAPPIAPHVWDAEGIEWS